MRVATFPDPQYAGIAVSRAALARGHELTLTHPDVAYVRTLNYGPWRALCLERMTQLHRDHVHTIPSFEMSKLYDDKMAQYLMLAPWMPRTWIITDPSKAPDLVEPLVSKASRGSASHNVRLITTPEQKREELRLAFGVGIKLDRGMQRGYLIWQELIPTDHDIRVVVCGEHMFGLRRFVRSKSEPFASGSGKREEIMTLDDPEVFRSFVMAGEISRTIGARWSCYDFVSAGNQTYVLEVSTSWSEAAYDLCPTFDRLLVPTGRKAIDWPDFAVDEMDRLVKS